MTGSALRRAAGEPSSRTRSVTTGGATKGRLLLGRGAGADQLAERLAVGKRVRIAVSAAGSPRVAVGGRSEASIGSPRRG